MHDSLHDDKASSRLSFADLFCGAGGFTWGWVRAGFIAVTAIDIDSAALRTHVANFGHLSCRTVRFDLSQIEGEVTAVIPALGRRKIDVVIGGPPCQGWSRVGRGKLRSLGQNEFDIISDPRNSLYRHFINTVKHLRPTVCVMENVPGMLSVNNTNVAEEVRSNFNAIGYDCNYGLVNSKWFGVPQDRNRLIFIATNGIETIAAEGLEEYAGKFRQGTLGLSRQTTVADAIIDLPALACGEEEAPIEYVRSRGRPRRYTELMREGSNGLVLDHVCRKHNDQDVKAFASMHEGMKYHELDDEFKRYRDDIFKDKYKKLVWDEPSWTVTAHLGKDCYTHIHPEQPRTISVREAARLQSFPDCFHFWGNMGERFKQIGNAVPPLMAWGIAEYVKDKMAGQHI